MGLDAIYLKNLTLKRTDIDSLYVGLNQVNTVINGECVSEHLRFVIFGRVTGKEQCCYLCQFSD